MSPGAYQLGRDVAVGALHDGEHLAGAALRIQAVHLLVGAAEVGEQHDAVGVLVEHRRVVRGDHAAGRVGDERHPGVLAHQALDLGLVVEDVGGRVTHAFRLAQRGAAQTGPTGLSGLVDGAPVELAAADLLERDRGAAHPARLARALVDPVLGRRGSPRVASSSIVYHLAGLERRCAAGAPSRARARARPPRAPRGRA